VAIPLSENTEARLARLFRGDEREAARRRLEEECAEDVPGWSDPTPEGLERLRFAVLEISGGSTTGLECALELARKDWRDALVAAGFADDPKAHESWWPGSATRFLVIERYGPGGAVEVYRRFRERGRLLPEGVRYVASWVDLDFRRCFQVMEADSEAKLREWTARWEDLVDFEIVPVRTSEEAAAVIAPRL
jgi:hypothetical protein